MLRSAVLLLASAMAAPAQTSAGEAIYKANCAFCHGVDGAGGRGSSLQGQLQHGSAPADVAKVIQNGVPGTQMPSFGQFEGDEMKSLVEHVLAFSNGKGQQAQALAGDPAAGQQVYAANSCASCHRINGQGSLWGPDLSRVGTARSVSYLRDSIVKPDADVPDLWQGVTVTGKDGKTVRGLRANEDSFSVQVRLPNMRHRSFLKSEVASVQQDKNSLMPAYRKLSEDDLNNLIAYLQTLRGGKVEGTAAGDKGVH